MALQDRSQGHNGLMAFADCAVVIDPTSMQLADIAIATAESTRVLLHTEPLVALLSFSTKGSAKHPQVDTVVEALEMLRAREPDLSVTANCRPTPRCPRWWPIESAGIEGGGARQHADISEPGAGNIGYKLLERLGGATAIGRSCRDWRSPPTTFLEVARRKTSSTWRW